MLSGSEGMDNDLELVKCILHFLPCLENNRARLLRREHPVPHMRFCLDLNSGPAILYPL